MGCRRGVVRPDDAPVVRTGGASAATNGPGPTRILARGTPARPSGCSRLRSERRCQAPRASGARRQAADGRRHERDQHRVRWDVRAVDRVAATGTRGLVTGPASGPGAWLAAPAVALSPVAITIATHETRTGGEEIRVGPHRQNGRDREAVTTAQMRQHRPNKKEAMRFVTLCTEEEVEMARERYPLFYDACLPYLPHPDSLGGVLWTPSPRASGPAPCPRV